MKTAVGKVQKGKGGVFHLLSKLYEHTSVAISPRNRRVPGLLIDFNQQPSDLQEVFKPYCQPSK